MNYRRVGDKIYISLQTGDLVNKSIYEVAVEENIVSSWIYGIGAIKCVEVGYLDIVDKEFQRKVFDNCYELLSLNGNITYKDNVPFIHTHITFSDINYNVYGGHLFEARITASGEIMLTLVDSPINRLYNENVGIHTWCLIEES